MECVICKQEITADPNGWEGGCNAQPVEDGQCCYECDMNVVLPARLAQYNVQLEELRENNDDHIIQSDLEDGIAEIERKTKGAV